MSEWKITGDRLFDVSSFAENQDLDFYLALKEAYPEEDFLRYRMDVFAYMPLQDEFKLHGLDIKDLVGCFDLDENCIDRLCIALLKSISEYKRLQKGGETHIISRNKVIPFALIDYIIELILRATEWHNIGIVNTSFNILIRERLSGKDSPYRQAAEKKHKKHTAIVIAEQLIDYGKKPTFREISKIMGVQPSTVMRWFPDNEFETELKTWMATRSIRDGTWKRNMEIIAESEKRTKPST
ncbi:hypothetical protein [Asticcacaulis sp. AC402]|uniref:hypothetical protein n=1 Tax=Asticcacaulis sp. AC402 TaxID=1282361 RepID=UPI0003C3BE65|nr:hypothetical protein [Asticcacaulis sp. AC402]ESQ75978.1 hypothetical protein ABAC402_05915 [Asticcacaulis sp. AC402]